MTERTATASWQGTLIEGSGTVSMETGVISDQPVTWAARTGDSDGMTSPEELIAAAHAACYAMAFSNVLAGNGTPADSLDVTASVGFAPKTGGGMEIPYSKLTVVGKVPGLTSEQFAQLAIEGEEGCPVSKLLKANITMDAKLA